MHPGDRLRRDAARGTLQIPGAFNALVARKIQQAGFSAAYLSGAAFSAGAFAIPDIGLFTVSELAEEVRRVTRAAPLPLVVDADTGFGEAVNVERTIHLLDDAGAAAVQLEDQQLPKRCGHLSGKSLVEPEAMCAKLRAAAAARGDSPLVILARTDARGTSGFDEAVDRARRYLDAGADWIFPEALANRDEFARFAELVDAPLVANMTEFGKSELLSFSVFQELGYAGVLYPVSLLRLAMKTVDRALATLAAEGTQESLLGEMQTRQELYDLLGYTDYEQRDRTYFRGDEAS
jgi:methylisocitrate lyase